MQKHRYNNAWLSTVLQISALCIARQYVLTNKEIVRTRSNERGEKLSSTHLLTHPIFLKCHFHM